MPLRVLSCLICFSSRVRAIGLSFPVENVVTLGAFQEPAVGDVKLAPNAIKQDRTYHPLAARALDILT